MAITPRTLLKNPLILIVATLSFFAITGLTFFALTSSCKQKTVTVHKVVVENQHACNYVASTTRMSEWTENDFIAVAACYDGRDDSLGAINVTDHGLRMYPRSESLFNIKGYHQIELKQHEAAVQTLRRGLKMVRTPSNGTMENNLAWAGLWVPRTMNLGEARNLYSRSLQRDAKSCEAIHTGLWVEFAVAAKANGPTRNFAIKRYDRLRDQYDGCEKRALNTSDTNVIAEVLGAGVLDYEMATLSSSDAKPDWARRHTANKLIKTATSQAKSVNAFNSAELCEAATPIGSLQHSCLQLTKQKKTPCR